MTCIKAQSMITPFINNKLGMKELEEFLAHVDSCPDCMEELEFYYTLLTAMKQLDEDKNLSANYKQELSTKLKRAQDRIIRVKHTYYRKITIMILLVLSLVFVLGVSEVEESKENIVNVSNRSIDFKRMFRDERYNYVEMKLEEYCIQQGISKITLPDFEQEVK